HFPLQDKLHNTRRLDELGVDFIEGGYPLSNPKDFEYFREVRTLSLKHAQVAAFGMTRRKNARPEDDTCLKALLDAQSPVVTIVGKTWDLHVREVLGTTLEENLRMIADSVAYCQAAGRQVFYDAEHFFDGYKRNPEYALRTLRAAQDVGASVVILCDTNGGNLPDEIAAATEAVRKALTGEIGMNFRSGQPFVGASAFAHKGGMHAHAVARNTSSYEHIDPALVGNERRILVSELSGQSTILAKTTKYALRDDRALMQKILAQVQD